MNPNIIALILAVAIVVCLILRKAYKIFTYKPEESRTLFSVDPDLYVQKRIFFQILAKSERAGGRRQNEVRQEIEEMEAKTVSDIELGYLRKEADEAIAKMGKADEVSHYSVSHT